VFFKRGLEILTSKRLGTNRVKTFKWPHFRLCGRVRQHVMGNGISLLIRGYENFVELVITDHLALNFGEFVFWGKSAIINSLQVGVSISHKLFSH